MINLNKEQIQLLISKDVVIECFDEIYSTSTYLRKNISRFDRPCIVISKRQTSGRGRKGNAFISNKESCYFSFSLFEDVSLLTLKVAVSIVESLKELYDIKTDIKWVNDIFFNNLKCGGILSELTYVNNKRVYIIGIGLNINVDNLDDSLNDIATSIHIDKFDMNVFVSYFYNTFIKKIYTCDNEIIKEYKSHMLLLNRQIDFQYDGIKLSGIVKDLNNEGNLIVDVDDKDIVLNSGEVSLSSKNIAKNLNK